MSTKYIDLLLEHIDAENDMDALLRLVPRIGFDVPTFKSILRQHVCNMDKASARKGVFNIQSIDRILPRDMLQNIEAFNHSVSLRLTNKSFKNCYDRNQEMVIRRRPHIVEKHKSRFSPQINHDQCTNQIFIVHPEEGLSKEPAEIYGVGVFLTTDLMGCIVNAASGDKIFVDDGSYELFSDLWLEINDKHLQIIGIGENVKIDSRNCSITVCGQSKKLLKKLHIDFGKGKASTSHGITIDDTASLWIEDCNMRGGFQLIRLNSNSSVFMLSSRFTAQMIVSGICHGKSRSSITALGCTFNARARALVLSGTLLSIGNIFKNTSIKTLRGFKGHFEGNVFKNCCANKRLRWLESRNKIL